MRTPYKILSTRKFPTEILSKYEGRNVLITSENFISTNVIKDEATVSKINELATGEHSVVFTSANAVTAVASALADTVSLKWKIFCIGHATLAAVKAAFGEQLLAGTANDAALLAAVIAEGKQPEEILFFCGTSRRNELIDGLLKSNIIVNELHVYETIAVEKEVNESYDAILFFSPSGVRSFFQLNAIAKEVKLFAIGQTTATELKLFTNNTVLTAPSPDAIALLEQTIAHFSPVNI